MWHRRLTALLPAQLAPTVDLACRALDRWRASADPTGLRRAGRWLGVALGAALGVAGVVVAASVVILVEVLK